MVQVWRSRAAGRHRSSSGARSRLAGEASLWSEWLGSAASSLASDRMGLPGGRSGIHYTVLSDFLWEARFESFLATKSSKRPGNKRASAANAKNSTSANIMPRPCWILSTRAVAEIPPAMTAKRQSNAPRRLRITETILANDIAVIGPTTHVTRAGRKTKLKTNRR